ncbi:hypothetical protein SANT12839_032020 [Streptomyces antimycoticus]|uniref:PAS domain-containing protein n=1 Tax=Streptomyces antimycoticus TaxID=68175 RepID=A0A4D4K5P6_9ACTN|nr:hypothetical protein SANT12839_032020 [Streptomyces antimycoticus]
MDRPGALGRPAPDMIGEPLDTSAAIVLTDPGGRVTAWSTGARRLLGYAPAEIIGSLAADLFASAPDFPAGKQVEQGRPREKQGAGQEQGRPREERDGSQEQTRHTAVVRHRDGHRLTAEVLTAPLIEGDSRAGVLLLFTPDASATHGDDRLMRWLFTQSPVGLVIYGRDRKLLRANDEMERKIEHQEDDVHGLRPSEILEGPGLEGRIDHVVATGEHDSLECYVKVPGEDRAHAWVMDLFPLKDDTGYVQAVAVAVFDYSQQYGSRERLAVLDEARTRIGTSLDVTGTAHELAEVAVPRFADSITVELLDSVFRGDQPPPLPPGGVTLRRAAHVSGPADLTETVSGPGESPGESPGDGPGPAPGETHFHTEPSPPARCLLTSQAVVHQATDPEIAVWLATDPVQAEQARRHGLHSLIAAPLKARGKDLGVVLLVRHTASREPFTEDDLFVTENLVARAAICMDNARRYAREHGIALALQRSLLAYRPEAQHAVDVASRYLPSESGAGVGGDWFDVIPLPCARVGLVVGDVVGHGINASAAMGRLRTAVRTLADIDLPPDELLTHLDDIVTHATPKVTRTPARSPPTWAPPASTPSTTPSPDTSPSPQPATRPPPSSPPAAPSSPSTCRPAPRWAWEACPSRQRSWRYPRALRWCSSPTACSKRGTETWTKDWKHCATAWNTPPRRQLPPPHPHQKPCATPSSKRCCPRPGAAPKRTTSPWSSPAPAPWTKTTSPNGT